MRERGREREGGRERGGEGEWGEEGERSAEVGGWVIMEYRRGKKDRGLWEVKQGKSGRVVGR